MARKTESSSQLTIMIGLVVLLVVAILFAGAFYSEQNKTKRDLLEAKQKEEEAKAQASTMFDYNVVAAELVTGDQELNIDAVKKTVEDAKKFLPDSNATSLKKILVNYQQEIDKKSRAAAEAEKKREFAEKLQAEERKTNKQQLESKEVSLQDRTGEVNRLKKELTTFKDEANGEKQKLKEATDSEVGDLNKQIGELKDATGKKDTQILELEEKLRKLNISLEPTVQSAVTGTARKGPVGVERELVDGHILLIDETMRLAIIDLGRNEGVKRGLRFNVYRDGGINSRHLKGQIIVKKVNDLISEAYVTYQRGQGQLFYLCGEFSDPPKSQLVEKIKTVGGKVAEILGPTVNYLVMGRGVDAETIRKAQDLKVPTVRDHQLEGFLFTSDTIRPGDIIINPAFDSRHQEHFYLYGDFTVPREVLKERIEEYGSRVMENVDAQTDYLVIGSKSAPEDKEPLKKANENGVSIIREEELLAFLED